MTKTKNNRFGKLIPVVLVIVFLVCLAVFMTACDGNNGADGVGIASAVINDAGELVITYTDGNIQNLGKIVGDNGTPGSTGNGIESITVDEEGMLVIEFTDGTSERFELPSPSVEECSHDNSETIVINEHYLDTDTQSIVDGVYLDICPDCGKVVEVIRDALHVFEATVVEPTCTKEGYTGNVCTICGYAADKTDIVEALGHEWSDEKLVEYGDGQSVCEYGGMYVHTCDRCGETEITRTTEATGHKSAVWEKRTDPTLTSEGTLYGLCEYCGDYVTIDIPALNAEDYIYEGPTEDEPKMCTEEVEAKYTYVIDDQEIVYDIVLNATNHTLNGKDATTWADDYGRYDVTVLGSSIKEFLDYLADCADGTPGKGYYICEVCDNPVYVDTVRSHVYDSEPEVTLEPTCDTPGEQMFHCTYCDDEVTEEIPALGHSYEYEMDVDVSGGTYTLTGTCSVCGDETTASGNAEDLEYEIIQTPTCAEEGIGRYTLIQSGVEVSYEVAIEKRSHTLNGQLAETWEVDGKYLVTIDGIREFKDWPSSCDGTPGKGYYICEVCSEDVYVDTWRDHTLGDDAVITDADCTTSGSAQYTCTECGEVITQIIEALGHDYVYTVTVQPTADMKGCITVSCSRCEDYSETIEIPELTDAGYASEVLTEATCSQQGNVRYTITVTVDTDKELVVTFDVIADRTAHMTEETLPEGTPTYTWTDAENGLVYTGYICEDCGKMIVIKTESLVG